MQGALFSQSINQNKFDISKICSALRHFPEVGRTRILGRLSLAEASSLPDLRESATKRLTAHFFAPILQVRQPAGLLYFSSQSGGIINAHCVFASGGVKLLLNLTSFGASSCDAV